MQESAEKMVSTRPGKRRSQSRSMALASRRLRFSCEPHRLHGMIGKPFQSA